MNNSELLEVLLSPSAGSARRLEALASLGRSESSDGGEWVNNHIHTSYSFSPYTPAAAVYFAAKAGLSTAGIMDHDSVGGIREFIEAGRIIALPVTVGFECRTSVGGTELYGKRLNNPDQKSVAYVTLHGIAHSKIDECERVLAPLRETRNERNRKMCERINTLVPKELSVDFEGDVLPLSSYYEGGSVTERHVLYALAKKLIAAYPERERCISEIENLNGEALSAKLTEKLCSAPEDFYSYDVLGVLKSSLISKIYIDADAELMHIKDFASLAKRVGGISAYAYLGDVGESPTGDKKAQSFEDSYLDALVSEVKNMGFNAITYMPSRNTPEQLSRIMRLCDENGLFQISGEDINSPRQSFTCPAMREYKHLYTATYALIGHEKAATENIADGMFADETIKNMPSLAKRIEHYAKIGREL